jgi:hypothetical protein
VESLIHFALNKSFRGKDNLLSEIFEDLKKKQENLNYTKFVAEL